jgi:hypothetical protein
MIVLKTVLCGAVLAAAAAAGPAAFASCSVATLQGGYGLSGSGWTPNRAGTDIEPFAVEGRVFYDGKGTLNADETHFTPDGGPGPATPTGTYTVNADCTGTFFIKGGKTLNFVIDQNGAHIRAISTTVGGPTLIIEYSAQFPQNSQ